ncbi:unnamed protein product [Toxocara canis]|uniref:Exonuclease 1 n=1 Tax=Toxocara canis TaxID=6265 RepID=A0A183V6S4_TOXCA|nr:unnamed protein product [Toxocara canis]
MGIQNLLPFVKKACRQSSISEFTGHSIAVDVSCLLHRGLFGCADRVAQGIDTDFYVRYVMKYVKLLLAIHCHVILVFDGKPLPAKHETNTARREKRDEHQRKGEQLLSEGKTSEAYDCFKRSTTITREIVENTIQAFQGMEMVDVLVAPYESDAQLAFLTQTGMAHAVITEDSDLIAFGCERIIFKMEPTGACTVYERSQLPNCLCRALADNFDFTKFRRICILAGCDYLQSGLPGVGLNKAATFMAKTSGSDLERILPRLPRYLNMSNLKIKKEFITDVIRAENTFLYQIVYDPRQRRQRPLYDYPSNDGTPEDEDFVGITVNDESEVDYSYAGEIMLPSTAMRMALGNLADGPPICDKFILPKEIPEWSIWSPVYKSGYERMKVKEKVDKAKKEACGAFRLTAVRKARKSMTILESSRGNGEKVAALDSSLQIGSQDEFEGDDDFIAPKGSKRTSVRNNGAVRSATIKACFTPFLDFFRSESTTCKSKPVVKSKFAERSPTVKSMKVSKGSNSAAQNWNCDDLLRLYALDGRTAASNASPTSSQQILSSQETEDTNRDEVTVTVNVHSDSCLTVVGDSEKPNQQSSVGRDADTKSEVSLKRGRSAEHLTVSDSRTKWCSSYFLNRGAKTSGLSKRSFNPFKKPKILTEVADEQNVEGDTRVEVCSLFL